jgi:hypothetical protein
MYCRQEGAAEAEAHATSRGNRDLVGMPTEGLVDRRMVNGKCDPDPWDAINGALLYRQYRSNAKPLKA